MAGTLRFQDPVTLDAGRDPAGPRPGTVVAGVVAAAILIAAGAVAMSGGDSPRGARTAGPAVPAVPATAGPTPSPTALLGVDLRGAPAVEQGPLLVAPEVDWQLFAGVPLPYSRTAGPARGDGPVYSGYERSQTGALIAATHVGTRYLLTPDDGWREVLQRQVLPGVGRDTFARLRAGVDDQAPPGMYGQPAGFRFVAFTPDVAAIQLVSRFPLTGVLQVVVVTVKWVGGDWHLELQPDGGSSPTAQAVPDLDGFVVWGI